MLGPIIIVNDDECHLQTLDAILRRTGYESLGFTNASTALETMQWVTPSLIILDLLMTPMNGFELGGYIHTLPHLADIPIVLMSTQADFLMFQGQASKQISAFLAKPIRQHDALDVIDGVLAKSRLADHSAPVHTVSEP